MEVVCDVRMIRLLSFRFHETCAARDLKSSRNFTVNDLATPIKAYQSLVFTHAMKIIFPLQNNPWWNYRLKNVSGLIKVKLCATHVFLYSRTVNTVYNIVKYYDG